MWRESAVSPEQIVRLSVFPSPVWPFVGDIRSLILFAIDSNFFSVQMKRWSNECANISNL